MHHESHFLSDCSGTRRAPAELPKASSSTPPPGREDDGRYPSPRPALPMTSRGHGDQPSPPAPARRRPRRVRPAAGKPSHVETVGLLDADPELGARLSDARRGQAEHELVVRTHRLPVGPCDISRLTGATAADIGLLITSGVLSRKLILANRVSPELLGPGDVVRPWPSRSPTRLLPVDAVWSVLSPLTAVVLDRRFAVEVARYPEITAALFDRLTERSTRLATTKAITQLNGVDRRLKALFWHLAERWGRVSVEGVIVPLVLTHRVLGQLVGARRPTVSTALSELAARGELARRPDGCWLLRGHPSDTVSLARRATDQHDRGTV